MEAGSIEIIYEGNLRKSPPQGKGILGKIQNWQIRWFVLFRRKGDSQFELQYYTHEDKRHRKGFIDLESVESVTIVEHKQLSNLFIVVAKHKNKERNYMLSASCAWERKKWVDYLVTACALDIVERHLPFQPGSVEDIGQEIGYGKSALSNLPDACTSKSNPVTTTVTKRVNVLPPPPKAHQASEEEMVTTPYSSCSNLRYPDSKQTSPISGVFSSPSGRPLENELDKVYENINFPVYVDMNMSSQLDNSHVYKMPLSTNVCADPTERKWVVLTETIDHPCAETASKRNSSISEDEQSACAGSNADGEDQAEMVADLSDGEQLNHDYINMNPQNAPTFKQLHSLRPTQVSFLPVHKLASPDRFPNPACFSTLTVWDSQSPSTGFDNNVHENLKMITSGSPRECSLIVRQRAIALAISASFRRPKPRESVYLNTAIQNGDSECHSQRQADPFTSPRP